jgi:DNA-binding CsgD family transcriptional regulator
MNTISNDYSLFFRFIETYLPDAYNNINPDDPLMLELEEMMEENNQCIYIADIIKMRVLFTSKRSTQMFGIEPKDITPYIFMEAIHPLDAQRLSLGRAKIIKLAQDLFIEKEGYKILSTNFRIRNAEGGYSSFLIQNYVFFTTIPYKTVFFLKIHTNIDWCQKIYHGYHYYIGNDLAQFKYPDEELLNIGNVFSKREFEIIRLIASGLSSEKIAEKLFISQLTINTHRANILKKTEKAHISELIYELQERGIL